MLPPGPARCRRELPRCPLCRNCSIENYLDCLDCINDVGITLCSAVASGTPVDELPLQCQLGNGNDIANADCCSGCAAINYPYFQYYESRFMCWCFSDGNTLTSESDSWVGQSESARRLPAAYMLPLSCKLAQLHWRPL